MKTRPTTVFVLLFLMANPAGCDVTKLPGHLQRFGQGRQSSDPIDVVEGFPSPTRFFGEYIRPQKPLLMKGAAKLSVAFTLWTDEYLGQHPEAKETYVAVEEGKKENRSSPAFDSDFAGFVGMYKKKDVYLVNRTPVFLRRDIMVPCPIQCPKLLQEHVHTVYMWFSSGGTKSVVHNDNLENINCLFRGDKQLVMVDPSRFTIPFDHADQGFTSVDVDSVDYTKYPWAADVEYQHVNMTAGDCLYIPTDWYHQVNSNGSNLAVNIWLDPGATQNYNTADCNTACDLSLTLDQAKLFTQDKEDILDSLAEDKVMTAQEFIRHVVTSNQMDVDAIAHMQEFEYFASLVVMMMKGVANKEGRITKADLARLSPKSWHELTHALETLQLSSGNALLMEKEQAKAGDVTSEELMAATKAKMEAKKEEL